MDTGYYSLGDSFRELIVSSSIILIPIAVVFWLVMSIRSYTKTPDAYQGLRKRYLIMSIISGLILVGLTVSAIVFRSEFVHTFMTK